MEANTHLAGGDVEIATAEWVDWYNERRLHGELNHVTPAEFEATHQAMNLAPVLIQTR
ncbi:transposase [Leucobacter sp. cx-169]|nr:transposase [Leucobacter sp. cx-169]